MVVVLWIVLFIGVVTVLAYQRASLWVSTIAMIVYFLLMLGLTHIALLGWILLVLVTAAVFLMLHVHPLRCRWITGPVFSKYKQLMPRLSETERVAIETGQVTGLSSLFSGMPDWRTLTQQPTHALTDEEQAFLEGPVETLCQRLDHWQISRTMSIPDEIWAFLKANKFFALIIEKEYGGLAFSATAHGAILKKIASVSTAVATVVCVPNSLGPAELLQLYGTDEQKAHYLPRLASSEEIPCFALTSPVAGSDATSITDTGIVEQHEIDGEKKLMLRLNWDKRYITLAPIATVIGLAFKLYDPNHLLGEVEELGITCALIPANMPGVEIGHRHYPLDCAFPNGPTRGKDVLVPLEAIIGGVSMAGQGWKMLITCLAAGRGISLPSMVVGAAHKAAVATSAYSQIRRQFSLPIAAFGGVSASVARLVALAYGADVLRRFTLSKIDQGEKPALASAISKYYTTEMSRQVILDAMDVHGGKGICMGPNNYLAQGYIEAPISITVEGANILTRSMIIFGQGALRCHPYILKEMAAAELAETDPKAGLVAFDQAIMKHLWYLASNRARTAIMGITNARWVKSPLSPRIKRYVQLATRFSSNLAFSADIVMIMMGSQLKRAEGISGRFADILSDLYLLNAIFYEDSQYATCHSSADSIKQKTEKAYPEAYPEAHPVIDWLCQHLCYRLQQHFDALLTNLPRGFMRGVLRKNIFPFGRRLTPPSDALNDAVLQAICEPTDVIRKQLLSGLYLSSVDHNPIAHIETVLRQVVDTQSLRQRVMKAKRDGKVTGRTYKDWVKESGAAGLISPEEQEQLLNVESACMTVIAVDEFVVTAGRWTVVE